MAEENNEVNGDGGFEEPKEQDAPFDTEVSPEEVKKVLEQPELSLQEMVSRPGFKGRVQAGFELLREGMSNLFIAGDRSASRSKDVSDQVIEAINEDLAREGLTPEERMDRLNLAERVATRVSEDESDVRSGNVRAWLTTFGVAGVLIAGAALIGYTNKDDESTDEVSEDDDTLGSIDS